MVIYKTEFEIVNKSATEVFNWWLNLNNEKYTHWHKDHLFWNWLGKDTVRGELGSIVIFRERINNLSIKFRGKIKELLEPNLIRFQHSYLPVSVTFKLTPLNDKAGCKFCYELMIGYKGILGRILDPIVYLIYPKNEFDIHLLRHVHEENTSIP